MNISSWLYFSHYIPAILFNVFIYIIRIHTSIFSMNYVFGKEFKRKNHSLTLRTLHNVQCDIDKYIIIHETSPIPNNPLTSIHQHTHHIHTQNRILVVASKLRALFTQFCMTSLGSKLNTRIRPGKTIIYNICSFME